MSPSRFLQGVLVVIVATLCALFSAPAQATTWYVTPSGNDGSDCQTASTPCLTINGAIAKAADGDTVLVSEGTYTATAGDEVVFINKSVTLSGGWDGNFTAQVGSSVIDGGGVRRGVTVSDRVVVTAERLTLWRGLCVGSYSGGGGIYSRGNLTLNDCVIINNRSYSQGGGILNSGTLTVNRTTVTGNIAEDEYGEHGSGGGIYSMAGTVVLNDSTVSDNVCGGSGSGISAMYGATLVLNNSTVSGNSGGDGAGIYSDYSTIALSNSTISHNQNWGLLFPYNWKVSLQNTIIADNGASHDCSCQPGLCRPLLSGGYNLIGNGDGCPITSGSGDQIGSSAAPIDPLLLPLRDYGGPTPTHALREGSPALDAGNPASPGGGGNACLATDQRGVPRPVGSTCDTGAFEGFVHAVASIKRASPSPTGASSVDFIVTFTEAVTGVDALPPFSDFALTTTGITGASITAVSGSGDTYVVSIATGTSDGTIRLDVVDDDSILDGGGNPLGGTGVGNGDYTEGEIYTICVGPRTWYVATSGDDASDCQTISAPCLTINGAFRKVVVGCVDTILVARGTYTAVSGNEVVFVDKTMVLSGGWDEGFAAQDGTSIIDGGGARRGITVGGAAVVTAERFTIQHGNSFTGGGIYVDDIHCSLSLKGCIITGNAATHSGGGISVWNSSLVLNECSVTNNVSGAWGSGISSRGSITANRTTVSGNSSYLPSIDNNGYLALNDSTVSGNEGGGISNDGYLELRNCTVSGNSGRNGDGISSNFYDATAVLKNSTVSMNENVGVNIPYGSVSVQNTIIAGNGNGDCIKSYYDAAFSSGGYNLIGNGDRCALTAGPGDQIGSAAAPIDPLLLPLRSYGGPTQTHALRSGSPALNAGNPATPGNDGNACLATDQRGQPRPAGSACDIGAVEGFVTSVASITRLDPSPTFAASVDFAVTFSDPVTGVDTTPPFSDFALTTTGVAGAAINAVSGSGDTYTVSVLTGDRDGTIRLDVVDDDSIFNSDDTPMGGIGAGNGNFMDGEAYTVWGNPRVISVVRADPDPTDAASVDFIVTFSEPVNGIDLSSPFSDFTLTTTGVTTGTVSAVSGSGNTYIVTVVVITRSGNGTIRLDVVDDDSIVDASGNPLGGEGIANGNFTSGEPYTVLINPLLFFPSGRISTAAPRYEWSKVPRAPRYRYQLFKGSTLVYTKTVSWKACENTTCSDKPGTRLRMLSYKWRMQALVDGKWRRYSAYNTFTVSPRAGYWNSQYLDFTVTPDLASVSDFSLYVYVDGCGYYIITYPDLIPITDGRFAFGGPFYASGAFSTPFRVSGKIGLRMYDLPDCGYVSGVPFSWTGDWEAPALPSPDAAADSGHIPVTPMRAYRAGPFRVDPVAP